MCVICTLTCLQKKIRGQVMDIDSLFSPCGSRGPYSGCWVDGVGSTSKSTPGSTLPSSRSACLVQPMLGGEPACKALSWMNVYRILAGTSFVGEGPCCGHDFGLCCCRELTFLFSHFLVELLGSRSTICKPIAPSYNLSLHGS